MSDNKCLKEEEVKKKFRVEILVQGGVVVNYSKQNVPYSTGNSLPAAAAFSVRKNANVGNIRRVLADWLCWSAGHLLPANDFGPSGLVLSCTCYRPSWEARCYYRWEQRSGSLSCELYSP